MITFYHKVQTIESLQKNIDQETRRFQRNTGVQCVQHCRECCSYKDINSTPLEFLPFAWHAYRLGMLDHYYDLLEKHEGLECAFAKTGNDSWGCSIYPVRGFICRLFGFAAVTDKNDRRIYQPCRILKRMQSEIIDKACIYVLNGGKIPVMKNYYRRLAVIDPVSGNQFMPINQAIRKALEMVYFNLYYRESA